MSKKKETKKVNRDFLYKYTVFIGEFELHVYRYETRFMVFVFVKREWTIESIKDVVYTHLGMRAEGLEIWLDIIHL